MSKAKVILVFLLLILWQVNAMAQDRFPRPEFETDYKYPEHQMPGQRGPLWEYFDVAVLIAALSVTAWLAIRKRSRRGLLYMSLFSVLYFGFYKQGCICSVGSVQNVSMALFNSSYSVPLSALLFFIIPLVFALAFGRVFCAGVCPLGAIQELTGFRPLKIPKAAEIVLASIPFVYLAIAVVFAATESQFIICRYDPFIGIYRLDAPHTMIIFGALLLLAGIFINRPYCRYLCPYGVLLNIFSRFSWKHLTITPAECTNCRLCEESCPYDAILPSDPEPVIRDRSSMRRNFLVYIIALPLFAAAGAVIAYNLSDFVAGGNSTVRLAREIRLEQETGLESLTKAAIAFREAGKTEEELFAEEVHITGRFRKAMPWAGIFLGLSLGAGLLANSVRSRRPGYVPHQGRCYSCGKCFKYCPIKVPEQNEVKA
ncbi:MAG: 4Fe-4S binding protein [Bacteroidales bacterium]|nr:4Fe-4S binding protein [Bacteroidales bacterium]